MKCTSPGFHLQLNLLHHCSNAIRQMCWNLSEQYLLCLVFAASPNLFPTVDLRNELSVTILPSPLATNLFPVYHIPTALLRMVGTLQEGPTIGKYPLITIFYPYSWSISPAQICELALAIGTIHITNDIDLFRLFYGLFRAFRTDQIYVVWSSEGNDEDPDLPALESTITYDALRMCGNTGRFTWHWPAGIWAKISVRFHLCRPCRLANLLQSLVLAPIQIWNIY